MRKSRFTTEHIIGFIKQAEAGIPAQTHRNYLVFSSTVCNPQSKPWTRW